MSERDASGYEEHNAALRRDARLHEISRVLKSAIEQAGEALAELGLTADEAEEFIADTSFAAEWAAPFEEANHG